MLKMAKAPPCVANFLETREVYKIELGRYLQLEEKLKEVLGASDTEDFERKMLLARSQKRHPANALITLYNEQGLIFDKAASAFDQAEALQKKRVADAQAAINKDIALLDE